MGKFRSGKKSSSAAKKPKKDPGFNIFRNKRKGLRMPRKKKVTKEVPIQSKQWEFMIAPDDWFLAKVNVKSSDLVADTLKQRLTDQQKKIFRSTCFGHFLDMNDIAVNPQLIHQILLREINHPNDGEMWFRIGNDMVKFGMDEFYMMTGLRCNGVVDRGKYESQYCRLRNEYFSHVPRITNDDVFNVFIAMSNRNNRDVVIMGILFLLTQLMYNTAYDRFVDETLLVLVDSIELNLYPWGNDIFNLTISSLKLALRNKRTTAEGDGKPTMNYRLNGFVIAFQVWIYETLPILESKICTKVASTQPRILNWTSEVDDDVAFLNLATDIFANPSICALKMVPQITEALDPLYIALKRRYDPSKPSKLSKDESIHINDDDDFVVETFGPSRQPRSISVNAELNCPMVAPKSDIIFTDQTNISSPDVIPPVPATDTVEDFVTKCEANDLKGKQIVYDVDDSDDECELLSEVCPKYGRNYFPGETSVTRRSYTKSDSPTMWINEAQEALDKHLNSHSIAGQTDNVTSKLTLTGENETRNEHEEHGTGSAVNREYIQQDPPKHSGQKRSQRPIIWHEKYTKRLETIALEHGKAAEGVFILRCKVDELVTFVNNSISEALKVVRDMSTATSSNICHTHHDTNLPSKNQRPEVCTLFEVNKHPFFKILHPVSMVSDEVYLEI